MIISNDIIIVLLQIHSTIFFDFVLFFFIFTNAALVSGYNARRAEELKRDRYEAQVDQLHMSFVMESIGGFGDSCDTILVKIGRALADIDRTSRNRAVRRLKQRLQCQWMKSLGAALAAQAAKYDDVN